MQGPHQVAQKSKTTIFPFSFFRSSALEFIQPSSLSSGAGLPCIALSASRTLLFSSAGSTALRVSDKNNATIRPKVLFMDSK